MEPEGCSRTNHSQNRIQARVARRLRNAHLGSDARRSCGPGADGMAESPPMTNLRRRSRGTALVAIALLVAACGSTAPTAPPPTTAPTATPGAIPSSSPAPATSPTPAASDANAALYSQIESQVAQIRGLQLTAPVTREVLDEAGLRAYITKSFNEDNPESLVKGTEALYKALLLMAPDASLEDLYIELLTSQVAGLYDDKTKQMYVVSKSGAIGPAEEVTYAHEFTHALQDQHFGLRSVVGDAKDQGDRTMARTTLVEGDATLVMSLWAQAHLTIAELAQVATATDPASEAVLAKMPAILREPLLFPYTAGLTLLLGDFQRGGFAAVDQRFANPPDSTEQILHADKLASAEKPVPVSFPADLAGRLGSGWSVALQDTLGEFQLEILLRDAGGEPASVSRPAAAGWGGDRVAVVEGPAGATGVVLDTAWDTNADAAQFSAALDGLVAKLRAAGRSASVLNPTPDRVVLVSAESAATMGRLANVLGLAG
jgi:hypothetical protein